MAERPENAALSRLPPLRPPNRGEIIPIADARGCYGERPPTFMLTGGWHRGFWSKGYPRPAAVSDRPLAVATVGVKSTDTGSEECGRRGFASSIVASRLICHHAGIEGRMTMKDLHRKAHLLPHRRHPEHRSPRQPELRHRRHHLQGDCCPDIIQSVAALTANEKVIRSSQPVTRRPPPEPGVVLQRGPLAMAAFAAAAQSEGVPQLGEVYPPHQPFLCAD